MNDNTKDHSLKIEEIKSKVYNKLVSSGWGNRLKGFILSADMDIIIQKLIEDKEEGKRFVPALKDVFNAFEYCPYDKTRIIMIGQDPYPYIGVPDGLAYSCSMTGKPQPSLQYMFKEIKKTVSNDYDGNPDLKRWADQGILLLNSALTVNERKPGSHYLLWRPFIVYLIDTIVFNMDMYDTIFVFMGNKAKEYYDTVPDNFFKISCTHPASAAHAELENWDSGDLFNKINNRLKSLNKDTIVW
jgi:uracil-DNA glycosylase